MEKAESVALTQGEIADRIAIAELKRAAGLEAPDLDQLKRAYRGPDAELDRLREVNYWAWQVVERIHGYFAGPELPTHVYKSDVIEDCRRAHRYNRQRVEIKNAINARFGETLEEKTWT